MKQAIDETERRRKIQVAHNKKHGITPKSIEKAIKDIAMHKKEEAQKYADRWGKKSSKVPKDEMKRFISDLEMEMDLASQNLEFEKAAELRDEIETLKDEHNL
jgi:excinuclease ABC subunit B